MSGLRCVGRGGLAVGVAHTVHPEVVRRTRDSGRGPGDHDDLVTRLGEIVAEQDVLTATALCLEAYQRALPPKHLLLLPGGHFDPYVRYFARSSEAACAWFCQHLLDDYEE